MLLFVCCRFVCFVALVIIVVVVVVIVVVLLVSVVVSVGKKCRSMAKLDEFVRVFAFRSTSVSLDEINLKLVERFNEDFQKAELVAPNGVTFGYA